MNPNKANEADVVDQAFQRLRTRIAQTTAVPPAKEIAGRGRRRRNRYAALASLAVFIVLAGTYAFVKPLGGGPAPVVPGETARPSAAKPTGTRQDDGTKIPAGFLLHEKDSPGIDNQNYSASCFGQPKMRREAARDIGEAAARVSIFQDLYVYDSETTAKQIMAHLRDDLVSCSGFGGAKVLQAPNNPGWGDETAAVKVALPGDGANEHTGQPVRFVVVRVGTAIASVSGYPEIPAIDDDARALVGRLCRYDPKCQPKPGLPAPLATLTDGGEAWAAVLGTYPESDPKPMPGETIATAAELGYHATTVRAECDEGAAAALGLPEKGLRYTAVYFGNRAEADTFAAAVPNLKVTVVKVRTYCL